MEKDQWYRKFIKSKVGKLLTTKELIVSNKEIVELKRELELMLPLWSSIKIPCIITHGTEDYLVPKENTYFAQRKIPDSLLSIKMMKGTNHFIP